MQMTLGVHSWPLSSNAEYSRVKGTVTIHQGVDHGRQLCRQANKPASEDILCRPLRPFAVKDSSPRTA